MIFPLSATSQSIDIEILDDTGLPVTGLVAATFPTLIYSLAGANADVAFPALSDLATITTAYASGGVKERGNGVYRVDLPNGVFTTAGQVRIRGEATGKHVVCPWLEIAPSVASVIGAVGSVTGAVGSVTGNVGGNVTGSVGSVVGSVGGNVVGSVGSVTAGVTVTTNNDKTGYSLTQAFPTNFAALGISVGGHITTVDTTTDLANAPTAGDFTAAMKTSLNAATPASVTGSVGSVTGAVGSVTGNV
ncbi:MAG: hypothetical protein KGL35_05235, partial [Bradyrhizobium sp.]|nr:hypothetical protein [Bradyrhizobium sp.]